MANNIYKKKDIKLDTFEDLNEKGTVASFSQGDRLSDKLVIKLSNDGVPLDLTDATQVRIDFRKPDGKLVFQYCTMEDKPQGLISAILTTQTLAAPGKVYAEVTVQYPAGKDAVTRQFTFHVEQAIAGDKSLESTNEFPMLAKAIEAGELFEGVDLVAIINAGQLAAAALPKTGGVMTGNIDFTNGKSVQWFNGAARIYQLFGDSSALSLTDVAGSQNIWSYNPSTKTFNVNSATNLYKKTDLYANYLAANGNTAVVTNGTDLNTLQASGYYGGTGLLNAPGGDTGYWYVETIRYGDTKYAKQTATKLTGGSGINIYTRRLNNNVWESWSQSIQAEGGTINGSLTMNSNINMNFPAASKARSLRWQQDNVDYISMGTNNAGEFVAYDQANGKSIFVYYPTTNTFDMNVANSNLVKKAGDILTGTMTFNGVTNLRNNVEHVMQTNVDKGVSIVINDSQSKWSIGPKMTGAVDWQKEIALSLSTGLVTVADLATKKDGTTTVTLSAEATGPDVNYPLVAVRRNSTVMLKGAVTLNANATGVIVATLPPDLKPSGGNLSMYTPTSDGTAMVQVFVNGTTGVVAFSTNAKGKRVDFVLTYVI